VKFYLPARKTPFDFYKILLKVHYSRAVLNHWKTTGTSRQTDNTTSM